MIREHPILTAMFIVAVLVIAWIFDELSWKRKSDDEIIDMTTSTDPKKIMLGLRMLKKRKKDVAPFIRVVLPLLVADSMVHRVTAKMMLQECFPDDYALITNYSGSDNIGKCRENIVPLYQKYGMDF